MQEARQNSYEADDEPPPDVTEVPGVADAIESMPEPQEHAIEEAQRQAAETASEEAAKVDQHGVVFDPAIHSGSLTPSGHWRKKKGAGTSRVSSARSVAPRLSQAEQVDEAAQIALAQSKACGAAAAETIIALCRAIGGDDFAPVETQTENERAALHDAWTQYFIATGKTFSPGWLLVAANGGYIARRFTMPKTQTRLQRMKEAVAGWVARRRMRKNRATAPTSEISIDGSQPEA